jgi:addiction module HigA family antidote
VETITKLLKDAGLPTHRPPTSPGEMVRAFVEDLGTSQAAVARGLGITANRLNEVVQDKRGISADTALRLAAYFGTTPQFWLTGQTQWELWRALRRSAGAYRDVRRRRPRAPRAARRGASPASAASGR